MKSGNNMIQLKPDPRSSSLNGSGSKRREKGFNTPPFQCGRNWRFENIVQSVLMPFIHSLYDSKMRYHVQAFCMMLDWILPSRVQLPNDGLEDRSEE